MAINKNLGTALGIGPLHLVIHVQNYLPCAHSLFLSSS